MKKSYNDFLNEPKKSEYLNTKSKILNEFLNEQRIKHKKINFKFAERDFVKVKKNKKIGYVYSISTYSNGSIRFPVYTVNFCNNTNQNYKSNELINATKEEIEKFKFEQDAFKYNL